MRLGMAFGFLLGERRNFSFVGTLRKFRLLGGITGVGFDTFLGLHIDNT